MALSLRLRKMGRTNHNTFRLVVIDKRAPRDGKYIEMVGWYNPHATEDKNLVVKNDRVQFWLDKGIVLSENVKALIKRAAPEITKNQYAKFLAKKKKKKNSKKKK